MKTPAGLDMVHSQDSQNDRKAEEELEEDVGLRVKTQQLL